MGKKKKWIKQYNGHSHYWQDNKTLTFGIDHQAIGTRMCRRPGTGTAAHCTGLVHPTCSSTTALESSAAESQETVCTGTVRWATAAVSVSVAALPVRWRRETRALRGARGDVVATLIAIVAVIELDVAALLERNEAARTGFVGARHTQSSGGGVHFVGHSHCNTERR